MKKLIVLFLMTFLFIGVSFKASADTKLVISDYVISDDVISDDALKNGCNFTGITLNEYKYQERGYQECDINRFILKYETLSVLKNHLNLEYTIKNQDILPTLYGALTLEAQPNLFLHYKITGKQLNTDILSIKLYRLKVVTSK